MNYFHKTTRDRPAIRAAPGGRCGVAQSDLEPKADIGMYGMDDESEYDRIWAERAKTWDFTRKTPPEVWQEFRQWFEAEREMRQTAADNVNRDDTSSPWPV